LPDVLVRLLAPFLVLASLAAAPSAGAADRYDLKLRCKEKAMIATVTGPRITRVAFTTKVARVVVRSAPWTAEFSKAIKVVAKARLSTRGNPVVRLEAKPPRC
jgi:hypothetical protein